MDCRRITRTLVFVSFGLLFVSSTLRAGEKDRTRPGARASSETADAADMQKQLVDQAKDMGPWDGHRRTLSEATDNVFERQGWTSEPDRFTREVLRDVEQYDPWQYQERQDTFMNHMQVRYGLTEAQKEQLGRDMQREALMTGIKHFRTTAPIAMEIVRLRSEGKPFTQEDVQRWSSQLDPVLADAKAAVERVAKTLEESMSPDQRAQLKKDMDALLKRHNDVVRMVGEWKQGKWDPSQWGLDNDPIHAAQMREIHAREAERTRLVDLRAARDDLKGAGKADDESTWERYVRLFCLKYACDDRQKTTAFAILKGVVREAENIRAARKSEIDKLEDSIAEADTDERRGYYESELRRALLPIEGLFERLCRRLDDEVLRSDQRMRVQLDGSNGSASASNR